MSEYYRPPQPPDIGSLVEALWDGLETMERNGYKWRLVDRRLSLSRPRQVHVYERMEGAGDE